MKIIFLGTNGWYTNENGNTPSILIDSKEAYVVLDIGNGIYKLDKYITEDKLIFLFISHFHLDHVSGVHTLGKFHFKTGLDIFVGEGRAKDFETLTNPPFAVGIHKRPENISNMEMEIRLQELSEGEYTEPIPVKVIKQHHAFTDHGYRFILEGKVIAYTGDCGITEATYELAKNADVLISECSLKTPEFPENPWGHMAPMEVAKLAKEAGVKKLLLTHFAPNMYKTLDDRKEAERVAKEIFEDTTAAFDDLIVEV